MRRVTAAPGSIRPQPNGASGAAQTIRPAGASICPPPPGPIRAGGPGRLRAASPSGTRLSACNGTACETWQAETNGQLVNSESGRCLDATNKSSADGTPLQIWDCWGASNQLWNLP